MVVVSTTDEGDVFSVERAGAVTFTLSTVTVAVVVTAVLVGASATSVFVGVDVVVEFGKDGALVKAAADVEVSAGVGDSALESAGMPTKAVTPPKTARTMPPSHIVSAFRR